MMKVLMLTPYVTINSRREFSRNKTGFGYMVYDIARSVAELATVDVLASDTRGKGFVQDGIKFLDRGFGLFLRHMLGCLSPLLVLRLWKKYRMSRGAFVRLLYYWLISGYYLNTISRGGYDVVHIHGCSFATELWMELCRRCRQGYIVTLHGLNSFSDTVRMEKAGKQYERDFLQRVADGEFPITVISSGMKRIIEQTYGKQECKNISVVCNSFSFTQNGG